MMPTENRKTQTSDIRQFVTDVPPMASRSGNPLTVKTPATDAPCQAVSGPIVRPFRQLLQLEKDLQPYESLIYTIDNSQSGELPFRTESLDRARNRHAMIGDISSLRLLRNRLGKVTSEQDRISEEQAAVLLAHLLGGIPDFGAGPAEKENRLEALIVTLVHSSDEADYERCIIDQPISAEVLAIAVRIIWRDATREKALPFPGDVLRVCRKVRARLIHAHRMLEKAVDLQDNAELIILEFGTASEREAIYPGYDQMTEDDIPF